MVGVAAQSVATGSLRKWRPCSIL